MRVLHVIPSVSERSGGPGQAIVPMCRALQEQGIDVTLATTDAGMGGRRQKAGGRRQEAELRDSQSAGSLPLALGPLSITHHLSLITHHWKDVPTIFFPSQWGESFKYSRPFAKWLDKHVADFDVVHIHAVFNHACIAAARACRKRGVPYIVRPLGTLDSWSMKQKPLRKKVFWHAGIETMLTNAAAIQYTAKGEQQAVEESLKLNHGVVVPLGVESSRADPAKSSGAFMSESLGLAEHPYVLVLSRLHPKKALEVLVDAFLSLLKRKEFQAWRLVLAGEGPRNYVAGLKQTVEAHNAGDMVLFPGWLDGDKKSAALRHASLLALTSYHENFGLCVMESLAYGVPVLISPSVNLAPEIEAAGAGWIAPVERGSLETALAEALSSEEERSRRGNAGLELANHFTWERIASQLISLYDSVLSRALTAQVPGEDRRARLPSSN
jgi:glycosyltransferase involved in cell wall biosynthesis